MHLGTAFPNAFLSTAHISEYVEAKEKTTEVENWKTEKKIPSGKDLELIFKNV